MTQNRVTLALYSMAAILLAALLYVRFISGEFVLGTDTFTHPYKRFVGCLVLSGLAWMCFIPILKRIQAMSLKNFWGLILLGIVLRVMFLGSTPVYEDDWNRYLWDGAVVTQGINPYIHPPDVTFAVKQDAPEDFKSLQALSVDNENFTGRINNPRLSTIYPPVAMGVFTIAALIKPFNFDALRVIYLAIDLGALWLLSKTLSVYGREPFWSLLYWLNPMLIYSVYNAGHMDIILVPFLISALYLVKRKPLLASFALGLAAAVKIWPLVLGPVLLRNYKMRPLIFIGGGVIMAVTALFLLSPMLLSLGDNSGLQAYAGGWERSSFLFGYIEAGLTNITADAGRMARVFVAGIIGILSLWLAFRNTENENAILNYLMILPLCLFLLSPTGYPWYVIWFLPFLPFFPLYGAGLLTVTVAFYYVRYAMGERDAYEIYSNILVPLQFGLPILVLMFEGYKIKRVTRG